MYITYISVSKSTPLAVTGPNGQLASYELPGCLTSTLKFLNLSDIDSE